MNIIFICPAYFKKHEHNFRTQNKNLARNQNMSSFFNPFSGNSTKFHQKPISSLSRPLMTNINQSCNNNNISIVSSVSPDTLATDTHTMQSSPSVFSDTLTMNISQSQSKTTNRQVIKRTYREVHNINDDDDINITNKRRRLNNNNIETDKLNKHKHSINKYKKEMKH